MKYVLLMVILVSSTAFAESEDERAQEQARLDGLCEDARQLALQPRRQVIYDECVNRFQKDEEACKQEAAEYNGNQVGRSPLYYDLPECVEAFDYRKSYRSGE